MSLKSARGVARSTFGSQKCKELTGSQHFCEFNLRYSENFRRNDRDNI